MSKRLLLIAVTLFSFVSVFALAQETTPSVCDAFLNSLESRLSVLNIRLESYAFTVVSQNTDYTAWQDLRLEWQEKEPDCVISLRGDVVAMFAALGDVSAHSMYLKMDTKSNSAYRLTQEAIERAETNISTAADNFETITGSKVDVSQAIEGLEAIASRLETEI
jgi:hypothetical protein